MMVTCLTNQNSTNHPRATLLRNLTLMHLLLYNLTYQFVDPPLLPKWSSNLKYDPCLPAQDWGSCVSGLVFSLFFYIFFLFLFLFCSLSLSSLKKIFFVKSSLKWTQSGTCSIRCLKMASKRIKTFFFKEATKKINEEVNL